MTQPQDASGPVVSVIIPAFNAASFITEALESVFTQEFPDNYEVIVVNDGSPDTVQLERVLEPYRERIHYIVQVNRGPSGARNAGIRAARAPVVALLDADDIWERNYLAVQVAAMERDPEIDVLYPDALLFGTGPHVGRTYMTICPSDGPVSFESLVLERCNVLVSSVIARRDTIVRAGMFDETLRSAEDFDLWLRVAKRGGKIAYHREVLVRRRCWSGSLSSDDIWMCEHILRVLSKARATLPLTPGEDRACLRQLACYEAHLRLEQGKKAFLQEDTRAALVALSEANAFLGQPRLTLVILFLRIAPRWLLHVYRVRERLPRYGSFLSMPSRRRAVARASGQGSQQQSQV